MFGLNNAFCNLTLKYPQYGSYLDSEFRSKENLYFRMQTSKYVRDLDHLQKQQLVQHKTQLFPVVEGS